MKPILSLRIYFGIAALFLGLATSAHADPIQIDLDNANRIFKTQLTKSDLGNILSFCRSEIDAFVTYKHKEQERTEKHSVLSYFSHFGSLETLKTIVLAVENNFVVNPPKDFRKGKRYFYEVLVKALARQEKWAFFSELLKIDTNPNQQISLMLARNMIFTLLKNENLLVLNAMQNASGRETKHEFNTKLGIFVHQPQLSTTLNSKKTTELVAKDVIEYLLEAKARHFHDPSPKNKELFEEAKILVKIYISFYDKALPIPGRYVERSYSYLLNSRAFLKIASHFFPAEETSLNEIIESLYSEIDQSIEVRNSLINTGVRHQLSELPPPSPSNNSPGTANKKRERSEKPSDGHENTNPLHVGFKESREALILALPPSQEAAPKKSILKKPKTVAPAPQEAATVAAAAPEEKEEAQPMDLQTADEVEAQPQFFDWQEREVQTCSLCIAPILDRSKNDEGLDQFVLDTLVSCDAPQVCSINGKEVSTALLMIKMRKYRLFLNFVRSQLPVGLDLPCAGEQTVREIILRDLLEQNPEGQTLAVTLMTERNFLGSAEETKTLLQIFFQSFLAGKFDAALLLQYFQVSDEVIPYIDLNQALPGLNVRDRIINQLMEMNNSAALILLLDQSRFVSREEAPVLTQDLYQHALSKGNYGFARALLEAKKVNLKQEVPFKAQ